LKSAGGDREPPTGSKGLSTHFQNRRGLAAFEFRASKELFDPLHVSRVMTSFNQLSARAMFFDQIPQKGIESGVVGKGVTVLLIWT
jgi:hypothetical protein